MPSSLSSIQKNIDLITYEVKSEGSPIDGTFQVKSIQIDKCINKISSCEIELIDGSVTTEDFPVSDSDAFVPGNKIEVSAGYENSNSVVFTGIVTKQCIKVDRNSGPVLSVIVKDESIKMTVGRKNAYNVKTKDSDVMSGLISNNGLTADVTATSVELKELIQYYATDWDFLVARADINGMVVITESGKVSVKKPSEESSEIFKLTFGDDVLDFEGELNTTNQYKNIKSSSWDYSSQQVATGESSVSNYGISNLSSDTLADVIGLSDFQLQTPALLSQSELTNWSKAMATKSEYAKITGNVKFQGSEKALPGKVIELDGLGDRFTGKGFISGVSHDISEGNWITTAHIGLSTEWFTHEVNTEAPLASGLLPGMQGLQVGKVKQINDDPDSEFRVLIELPLITTGSDGVWARLAGFYATSGAGAFFYPETGDEVIVGFLNDDPNAAIILGSVYSSSRSAPFTPDEENNTKAIVTREQMKITFDEEKKIITVITPGNNQIVLSDDAQGITVADQNDNSIKLSPSGIDIKSASSINMEANESVTIKGNTGVTIEASGGDVSAKGLNVSCNASVEFKAEGASSQVSGSGMLKLQGGMVMIN